MKTGNKFQQPSRFTNTGQKMTRTNKGPYVSYEEYLLLFYAYKHQILKSKKAGELLTEYINVPILYEALPSKESISKEPPIIKLAEA